MGQKNSLVFVAFLACAVFHAIQANASGSNSIEFDRPTGLIYSLYRGKNFLWVAAENGLFAFNGSIYRSFDSSSSPLNNLDITDVFESKNGNLWLSGFGQGLWLFDGNNFIKIEELENQYCGHIEEMLHVYVTCNGYLYRSSTINSTSFERVGKLSNISTFTLSKDRLFVVLDSGDLIIYDLKASHQEVRYSDSVLGEIKDIFLSTQNDLWIGTEKGLFTIRSPFKDLIKVSLAQTDNVVSKIFELGNGEIWFFQRGFKRILFNQIGEFQNIENINSLSNIKFERILDVAIEDDDAFIFSAPLVGLVASTELSRSVELHHSLIHDLTNIQYSVRRNKEVVTVARENVIYDINEPQNILKKIAYIDGYIDAFRFFEEDKIMMATNQTGLAILDLVTQSLTHLYTPKSGIVTDIVRDTNGTYFSVASGGEERGVYHVADDLTLRQQLDDIIADRLLISTSGKLVVATRYNGLLVNSSRVDNLGADYIKNCLVEDGQGNIWMCTDGGGLIVWDPQTRSTSKIDPRFTANSRFIREVVEDSEGFLWIMTNKGLVRYDHQNKTSFLLGEEEGISDVDFEISASIRLPNDKILIAGDTQNYVIDTKTANEIINIRLTQQTVAQIVELTTLSGKVIELVKKESSELGFPALFDNIEINEDDTNLKFKFATSNFLDREVLGYEYRLMGFENQWQYSTPQNANVTYSSLPSGDYVFQLRVKDPKSQAYQPPTQLKIKVNPPFWQTWQAYSAYAGIGLISFILAVKIKNVLQKAIRSKLETSIRRATIDLAESDSQIGSLLRRKESLFASASHELRTPLTLINSPLEKLEKTILARAEKDSIKQLDYIKMIKANTLRLTDLVDQILELSKLDYKISENREVYQLDVAIQRLIGVLNPMAEMKGIAIKSSITGKACGELIPNSLDKILSNIIVNAIKYTPDFGTIVVNSYIEAEFFRIDIEDNGPGIEKQDLEVIFKRFTRLENSRNTSGSGLGLALAKELTTLNGGDILVESELNQGTCFSIKIPTSDKKCSTSKNSDFLSHLEDRIQNQIELSQTSILDHPSVNCSEVKVVIVEDEPNMQNMLMELLSDKYKCFVASNGEEALNIINEQVPDLILTDLMMPKMNGFELIKVVRENEVTSHIPILLLTAKSDSETRIEGWQKNVDEIISKPFINSELTSRVQNLIALRKMIVHRYIGPTPEDEFEKLIMLPNDQFFNERDKRFFDRFKQTIEKHLSDVSFSRKEAAEQLAISIRQLNRKLTALVGLSFNDYLRKYRLAKVRKAIESGVQITEASYDFGFSSPSYLSNCFKKEYGISPKAYIDNIKS